MTPDHVVVAFIGVVSLLGTTVNVYVALYVKAQILAVKADILSTVRAETYTREVIDLMLKQVAHG